MIERIVSIDIETTGLDPNVHSMLSMGAVDLESQSQFYMAIDVKNFTVSKEAFNMNKKLLCSDSNLYDGDKVGETESYWKLMSWVCSLDLPDDTRIVPLGHNVGSFDMLFVKKWMKANGGNIDFGYRCIDINSIYFFLSRLTGNSFVEVRDRISQDAEAWLKTFKPDVFKLGRHHALYDAWFNIIEYDNMRDMANA